MLFGNKKGQMDFLQVAVAVGVLLLISETLGVTSFTTAGVGGQAGGQQQLDVNIAGTGICTVDQTTLKVLNFNKYTSSTALSDGNSYWRLFLNEANDGLYADAATRTVSPGNDLRVYAGENSSNRYTQKITEVPVNGKSEKKIPCKGTADLKAYLAPIGAAPTVTYTNANGQVNTAQDLGADVVRTFEIKLDAPSKAAIGNPYLKASCVSGNTAACNRVCHQFNTTVVDNVEVRNVKIDGASAGFTSAAISTPRAISNNASGTNMGASQNTFSCWTLPPIEDNQQLVYSLVIDTASTAPGTIHSINLSLATSDYDLDADTLAEIVGVEDEDFNALGGGPFFLANPIDID